jgi:hypothetical protein
VRDRRACVLTETSWLQLCANDRQIELACDILVVQSHARVPLPMQCFVTALEKLCAYDTSLPIRRTVEGGCSRARDCPGLSASSLPAPASVVSLSLLVAITFLTSTPPSLSLSFSLSLFLSLFLSLSLSLSLLTLHR